MSRPSKQQLIDRIILRLETDSNKTVTASSSQLSKATTDLIQHANKLSAALSAPGLHTQNLKNKAFKNSAKQ